MWQGIGWQSESSPSAPRASFPQPTHPGVAMQRDDQDQAPRPSSPSTTGAWTVVIGAALIAAVTTKVVRSSRRAREAQYEARAWRRAFMAMADREASSRSFARRQGESRLAAKPRLYGGLEGGKSSSEGAEPYARQQESAINDGPPSSIASAEAPPAGKQSTTAELPLSRTVPLPKISGVKYIIPSADLRNTYSIVHPHEDWDWTPSDHPPRRTSWRRNRLPPWAIGFTSALKAARESVPKVDPVEETLTKESREEDMLKSAIWPESDPLKASDMAFIAGEAFEEIRSSKTPSATTAPKEDPAPAINETERMQHLERQVWALLERAKALEDRLRSRIY